MKENREIEWTSERAEVAQAQQRLGRGDGPGPSRGSTPRQVGPTRAVWAAEGTAAGSARSPLRGLSGPLKSLSWCSFNLYHVSKRRFITTLSMKTFLTGTN